MELIPTASQTIGPFFDVYLDAYGSAGCLAGKRARGDRVRIACRVLDGGGATVDDAMIEIWQADAGGKYNHPADAQPGVADPEFYGFGRLATNKEGVAVFETVKPGRVTARNGRLQAPHVNVSIFARGLLKRVVTRVYFAGDPSNHSDPVLALVPEDRRETLMAQEDPSHPGVWTLDIHLSGARETVFFEI